ncbi:MAG TPA: DUF4349 domain-containing protein [Micromonosporaceae bacterium]|nr:DUF4349 domain-containing protein [Micromonosporaceae bacterium]
MRTRMRSRLGLAVAVLGAALVLTGCSAGSDESAAPAGGPAERGDAGAPGSQGDPAQPGKQGDPAQPGAGAGTPAKLNLDTRSIVYTGELTVRVTDVDEAASRATELAAGAGGFVGSDRRTSNDRRSEAHLTLRVPAGRFSQAVDGLARLGTEERRALSTEDVTEAVVDLDARIQSQRASVARTRALLGQANNLGEIVSIEAELAKREGELAALEARKRRLADLTALSTVTVHLLGPDAAAPPKEREPGFLAGLAAGWGAFLGAMQILLAVLGFLLPFAVVTGLPVVLLIWLLRRRRPGPVSAPPPGHAGAPAPQPPVP